MSFKRLRVGALLGALLIAVLGLSSCDLFGGDPVADDIEIAGTWVDSYGGALVVTDGTARFYSSGTITEANKWQECEVVDYDNDGFNAGDSGTGDCGYMVIKYTEPSSYIAAAAQDKYGILRWQNLATASGATTMGYAEGYTDGTYSDTAAAAEAYFCDDESAFSYYSSATLQ